VRSKCVVQLLNTSELVWLDMYSGVWLLNLEYRCRHVWVLSLVMAMNMYGY
jgi:hypothetical protein